MTNKFNLRVYNRSKERIILLFNTFSTIDTSKDYNLTLSIRGKNAIKFGLTGISPKCLAKDIFSETKCNLESTGGSVFNPPALKNAITTKFNPLLTYILMIPVEINEIHPTEDLDCILKIEVDDKEYINKISVYGEGFTKKLRNDKALSSQLYYRNEENKWEGLEGKSGAIYTRNTCEEEKLDKILIELTQILVELKNLNNKSKD